MKHDIKVNVVSYGRKYLYMQYTDPMTGKMVTKSTGATTRKEAIKAAGKWEAELRDGRYKSPSKITWAEFRQRYEDEVLPGLAATTDLKVGGVFDAVERILSPGKLAALTAERISYFVRVMRAEETEVEEKITVTDENGRKRVERRKKTVTVTRSEATIRGHLASLKAALNWAKRKGMLHEVPNIDMPKRAKGGKVMKGRPITSEEFDRLLAAVSSVRRREAPEGSDAPAFDDSADWRWFLRGLWWSGLRLEEAINLWWDGETGLSVDLSGKRPMLRIPAEHEKGNQDRILPMAPEFAEMLLAVPQIDRTGRVFPLPFTRKDTVSKVVCEIGEKARIVVDRKPTSDPAKPKVKYASAHDLRRSFGERWATRVMPQVLMQLMRHESIETTMRFYVGRNAETTADVLYAAVAGHNTSPNTSDPCDSENAVNSYS